KSSESAWIWASTRTSWTIKGAALHGAASNGRNAQSMVDRGANLEMHDVGSRDTVIGAMKGWAWSPLPYAQDLVRVGVQSAIPHPGNCSVHQAVDEGSGLTIPPDITNSV